MSTQASEPYYEYATVDTNPGADGYWTEAVDIRALRKEKHIGNIYFSVRETGASSSFSATITLQFRCPDDTDWTDYDTYTEVTRKLIEGGAAGVEWRMGVKNGDYDDGEVTFGFDW